MLELGADTMRGVPWPSNGLTEIPFRVYTDPEQYRLEQERIFKGPTWSFPVLLPKSPNPAIMSRRRSARRPLSPPATKAAPSTPSPIVARIAATCSASNGAATAES